MIKPQIIKENGKPKAVIMEYRHYIRLRELAEDTRDYYEAVEAELATKRLHAVKAVKRKIRTK